MFLLLVGQQNQLFTLAKKENWEQLSEFKAGRTLELPAQQDVIRALQFSRKPQCAVSILELLPHSRLLAQIFNVLNNFRYE